MLSLGALISVAGSLATSVGGAIAAAVKTVGPLIANGFKTFTSFVGPALQGVFGMFGAMKPGENFEDLGDRAYQAGEKGIRPEKFDQYDDYLDEIRNFELDPEVSKQNTEAKTIMGVMVAGRSLEEKLDLPDSSSMAMVSAIMANTFTPTFFSQDRMQAILENKLSFIQIDSYIKGDLEPKQEEYLEENLFDVEKKLDPEVTRESFSETLDKLRNSPSIENQQ